MHAHVRYPDSFITPVNTHISTSHRLTLLHSINSFMISTQPTTLIPSKYLPPLPLFPPSNILKLPPKHQLHKNKSQTTFPCPSKSHDSYPHFLLPAPASLLSSQSVLSVSLMCQGLAHQYSQSLSRCDDYFLGCVLRNRVCWWSGGVSGVD